MTARDVYMKITSYAPYEEMNGIKREWIEKCIQEGMEAYSATKNDDKAWKARLYSSLGECVEGNDYEIIADKNGTFWISHKAVGSGEPLEQWIDSVINVR